MGRKCRDGNRQRKGLTLALPSLFCNIDYIHYRNKYTHKQKSASCECDKRKWVQLKKSVNGMHRVENMC